MIVSLILFDKISYSRAIVVLNAELKGLSAFSKNSGLKLNPGKCQVLNVVTPDTFNK